MHSPRYNVEQRDNSKSFRVDYDQPTGGGSLNRTILGFSGAALLVCAATMLIFEYVDHYAPASNYGELLENPDFTDGMQAWSHGAGVTLLPDGAALKNDARKAIASIRQAFEAPETDFIRVVAEVSLHDVQSGPRDADVARVDLYEFDPPRGAWRWIDGVFKGTGDIDRASVTATIPISTASHRMQIEAELPHATGTFTVHRLSATPAEYRRVFVLSATATLMLWCLLGGAVFIATYRARLPQLAWIIGAAAVISLASVAWIPPEVKAFFELPYLSIDHFAWFLAGTLLLGRVCPGWQIRELVLVSIVTALSTECLQYFSSSRIPSPVDFWSDILGIATGLLAAQVRGRLRV